jgi:hypothetical protein
VSATNPNVLATTRGAALKPLSPAQVRNLVVLAQRAFRAQLACGALPDDADFDAWRRQQVHMAVERPGLRQARNEDYLPLQAHFLRMLGRERQADACAARAAMEPRIWARHCLDRECAKAADVLPAALDYAAGFVRRARRVALSDADESVLWQAIFLVRRRAAQLRRSPGAPDPESPSAAERSEASVPSTEARP